MDAVIEFLNHEIHDEWSRLTNEFCTLPYAEFRWQPAKNIHSIGWHVRHAIEWRYALLHVWIFGHAAEERLFCLGWEDEPIVRAISLNDGWFEPDFTVDNNLAFLQRVRNVTRCDLESFPRQHLKQVVRFPWRTNRIIDEIAQDVRHSAVHRGHIRQLHKMYAQQFAMRQQPETSASYRLASTQFRVQ